MAVDSIRRTSCRTFMGFKHSTMATTTCCVCSFLLVAAIVPSVLGNMPFIHFICTGNATPLLLQKLQASKNSGSSLHVMDVKAMEKTSLRDELRLHSRYIRDTLAPILSRQGKLTYTDNVLLRSMFKKLEATSMTLDLLRYSRIEKALMVMAATGARTVRRENPSALICLLSFRDPVILQQRDLPLRLVADGISGPG